MRPHRRQLPGAWPCSADSPVLCMLGRHVPCHSGTGVTCATAATQLRPIPRVRTRSTTSPAACAAAAAAVAAAVAAAAGAHPIGPPPHLLRWTCILQMTLLSFARSRACCIVINVNMMFEQHPARLDFAECDTGLALLDCRTSW